MPTDCLDITAPLSPHLSQVAPGDYELICIPLRIAGVDGAPARATLQTL